MINKNILFTVIFIALSLSVLGCVSKNITIDNNGFITDKNQPGDIQNLNDKTSIKQDNKISPEILETNIDVSDWKLYSNKSQGFQINFPNELKIKDEKKSGAYKFQLSLDLNGVLESATVSPILLISHDKNIIKFILPNSDCPIDDANILCVEALGDYDFSPTTQDDSTNLDNQKKKYVKDLNINNNLAYELIIGAELPQTRVYIIGKERIYEIIGYNIPVSEEEIKSQYFWTMVASLEEI